MKKVAFHTLGCKLNFSESSTLARQLRDKGFTQVSFEDSPDIFVINTCSVTENADRKCRKIVRDAKRISPDAFIAVIGCYAQLKPREISKIEGVDLVLGAAEKFQLAEILQALETTAPPQVMACDITLAREYHCAYSMADRTRSFLKIQDGCDYGCTFCTIPLARGKSRSDTIENVLFQAQKIIETGGKEIVLTGVNTGDFGIVDGIRQYRFIELLQALDNLPGIDRIRISSIEPNLLNEDIISMVATSKKIVPHFHIPLQSGSDTILKRMRRRYLTGQYRERILFIKSLIPECCIGADIIVGFPGETDELFLESYNFVRDLPISYLHVFTYSERANTLAAGYPDSVPLQTRHQRSRMLRILSDKKRRAFFSDHLGETLSVLVEDDRTDGLIFGFTRNYIRVGIPEETVVVNQEIDVRLEEVAASGFVKGNIAEYQTVS